MKTRLFPLLGVALAAVVIVAHKHRVERPVATVPQGKASPNKATVLLVADLRETGTADNCAEIIRLVYEAGDRGLTVHEFSPDSKSDVLKRYQVLTAPTVLILDPGGRLTSRYEGEDTKTIEALRLKLDSLTEVRR